MKFKFLPHTADIKFQAFGNSIEEVFANSALALSNIIYEGKVKNTQNLEIKVRSKDFESLMYEFLEEFLILIDSRNFLLSGFKKIEIDKTKFELKAEVFGDDSNNYETDMHVKAITYHEMFVKDLNNKFIAQVVVDI